jgi:hypothetical protein
MVVFQFIGRRILKTPGKKSVFLVPLAELGISRFYRKWLIRFMKDPQVSRVTLQTNLAWDLTEVLSVPEAKKLNFWVTFHPGCSSAADEELQSKNITLLRERGIIFSVGIAATKDRIHKLSTYREKLLSLGAPCVWLNGMKGVSYPFYTEEQKQIIMALDPLATHEVDSVKSLGQPCSAGQHSVFINTWGQQWRCQGVEGSTARNAVWSSIKLAPEARPCPVSECPCYISLMLFKRDEYREVYGDTISCRVPKDVARGLSSATPEKATKSG